MEKVYGARFHKPDPGFLHKQKINILRPKKQGWKEKIKDWWSNTPWPRMYQGDLVKSQTRGTGAAVKGTTHEVMPGMDAAKKGKLIKARHGTQVRTRGSNPDNPYVTQGGEVQIATKLNGTLKTRTW
jgi:hypothetical protein